MLDRGEQTVTDDDFGIDRNRTLSARFFRYDLTQQNVVPSNQQSLYTGKQADPRDFTSSGGMSDMVQQTQERADALREQSLTMPSQTQQALGASPNYANIPTGGADRFGSLDTDRRSLTGTILHIRLFLRILEQY